MTRKSSLLKPVSHRISAAAFAAVVRAEHLKWLVGFGICFTLVGGWLGRGFFPEALIKQYRLERGPSTLVMGRITAAEKTATRFNGAVIWRYRFRYLVEGVGTRDGTAYFTGEAWVPDAQTPIRYLNADYSIALPDNGRFGLLPPTAAFVLLFPAVGLLVLGSGICRWWMIRRVFRYGQVTTATMVRMEKLLLGSRAQPTYRIEIQPAGNLPSLVKRSFRSSEINFGLEQLRSSKPVSILFDPKHRKNFFFTDVLVADSRVNRSKKA